jgi:thiamine-monophosphate kinase
MATKAEALGEFERIARFFAPLAAPGGLGLLDDAALVDCRAGRRLVITADAMVAGIHFRPEDPAEFVARKLLRVNLSDLAAMGARPLYYLLTTALPAALGAQWVEDFARGLGQDQQLYQVALLGGDSVSTPGPAALSLTAIGEIAAGAEIRRSGARPGDEIWVSGTIGDAWLGLGVLRGDHPGLAGEHHAALIRRFQLPEPRVALGPALFGLADAMIDISDGLVADLGHICEQSRVSAVIELAALPLSPAASVLATADPGLLPRLATGGDDYELLFTAAPQHAAAITAAGAACAVPVTCIGRIGPGTGVRLLDAAGGEVAVDRIGWRHF